MTPSETLIAAADLIRDLAAKTSPLPWTVEDFADHVSWEGDARWIAALSPALAAPLEAIFRFAALAHRMDNPGTRDESALAMAKAIFGAR